MKFSRFTKSVYFFFYSILLLIDDPIIALNLTQLSFNEGNFDVLVMGTHGHTGFKDLLFGTTVDKLRHKIGIPLLIVKN